MEDSTRALLNKLVRTADGSAFRRNAVADAAALPWFGGTSRRAAWKTLTLAAQLVLRGR